MIVYNKEQSFVLVKQHDHARLAGDIIKKVRPEWIGSLDRLEEFQFAVSEHDRAWIDMDEVPLWNDVDNKPYGVEDMPLLLRLPFYLRGLGELAKTSEYAALLVSLHYTTFQPGVLSRMVGGFHERALPFLERLKQEQQITRTRMDLLEGTGAQLLERHLNLLQLTDELSLYLCMQEPGTPKDQERTPFKDGLRSSSSLNGSVLQLEWSTKDSLKLNPFPLLKSAVFSYPSRTVRKDRIAEIGLAPAYAEATDQQHTFTIA